MKRQSYSIIKKKDLGGLCLLIAVVMEKVAK